VFALDTFAQLDEVSDLTRRYPYAIDHPGYFRAHLPRGPQSIWPRSLDQQKVSHPSFEFSARVQLAGSDLSMRYLYRTLQDTIAIADFSAYVEKMNQSVSPTSFVLTSGDPAA